MEVDEASTRATGAKPVLTVGTRLLGAVAVAAIAVVPSTTGCAHVKREEMQTELDRVRQELRDEMRSEDRRLGDRIDGLEERVDGLTGRVDELEERLDSFREEFDVTIQRLEGAIAFNVPVHFDYDSARIRDGDREVLERFAAVVADYYPDALVTVEGFTDPAGSAAYNQELGRRRAEAVKSYLVANSGLPADRLRTVSYGEARERLVRPGAQGPGEEGLENRRVSLVIDFNGVS